MNKKEQFLSMLHSKDISYMGYAFNAFPGGFPVIWDPITMMDASLSGEAYIDPWGALWRNTESDPGAIPLVNEENKVIKDITCWKEFVKFPSLENLDWTGAHAQLEHINREDTLVMIPSFYGPLERAHALMPFDECLINMYDEPEDMYDLFGALTDWKIKAMEKVIDELQPDIIHSHDDWGHLTGLFFSPEVFRELLKPHYKRLYDYIHSRGVLVQHHSDGYGQGLEKDMVDMGIDMWQGVTITNDIQKIKENTEGQLMLLGGLDQPLIDRPDASEEVIRAEVRRAIDAYAPGGSWLPCFPSVMPVSGHTVPIVIDECNRYGEMWLKAHN